MRKPSSLGLPSKFTEWRPGQSEVLRKVIYSDDRFCALVLPTGSGKSLTYMGYALLGEGRTCVVTSTRALQDQLMGDFAQIGMVDMRGRQNFICDIDSRVSAADAICTIDLHCDLKQGGCGYYDRLREARSAKLVVTNYAYWFHNQEYGMLGDFETLILDEAHNAPDEISGYAAVEIKKEVLEHFKLRKPSAKPWRPWANLTLELCEQRYRVTGEPPLRKKLKTLIRDLAKLCRLSRADWLLTRTPTSYRWDMIAPGEHAEELLFRGAKRVILASATVRKKTLNLLGIADRTTILEQRSSFPIKRRPVYYWPVVRVGFKMGDYERKRWLNAIDDFIDLRLDRKGILDPVSYKRGWDILRSSRHRSRFIIANRGETGEQVLARFRAAPPGTVLISPAVRQGVDFKYTQAEYGILAKVPFPDISAPLVKARMQRDKEYVSYLTLQAIVQFSGRGMRVEDDQFETLIVDGNFGWLRARNWSFAPNWFHAAVRTLGEDAPSPVPPPRLTIDNWSSES